MRRRLFMILSVIVWLARLLVAKLSDLKQPAAKIELPCELATVRKK